MVSIRSKYEGDLHCVAQHGPSRTTLVTDAPVDNQGRGESFSPTDLVATALGTCVLTTMGIYAARHGIDLSGATAHVEKQMTPPPRRIASLSTVVTVPGTASVSAEHRAALEQIAHHCPVRLSLAEAVGVPMTFDWDASAET